MKDRIEQSWFARFPEDLAWDIFTLDCMLATVLAMGVAGIAAMSDAFAQRIADSERWLWSAAITLAIVALVCLLRLVLNDGMERKLPRHWRP